MECQHERTKPIAMVINGTYTPYLLCLKCDVKILRDVNKVEPLDDNTDDGDDYFQLKAHAEGW